WMDPVYPKNLVSFDFRQFSKSCDACPPPAILGHENLETRPSVGARIPRIRLAGDPLCFDLCLGLLPTTSLIGMSDGSHAQSAHLLQRKYPPAETAPPSVSPGVSPLVGVAVQHSPPVTPRVVV